jgi:hypothetical protein
MANQPEYICTGCKTPTQRELLMVKKAVFLEMGAGGRTFKSRVVGWLCPNCVRIDTDWNQPKFQPPRAELKELAG